MDKTPSRLDFSRHPVRENAIEIDASYQPQNPDQDLAGHPNLISTFIGAYRGIGSGSNPQEEKPPAHFSGRSLVETAGFEPPTVARARPNGRLAPRVDQSPPIARNDNSLSDVSSLALDAPYCLGRYLPRLLGSGVRIL